jgi:hypothetical protein
MSSNAAIEKTLQTAYEAQAECYAQALVFIGEAESLQAPEATLGHDLGKVIALLEQVSTIEARIDAAKARWLDAGNHPGAQFQATLDRVRGLIESLQEYVQLALDREQERKDRLLPALDLLARGKRMQQAYALARREGR